MLPFWIVVLKSVNVANYAFGQDLHMVATVYGSLSNEEGIARFT